MTRSRSVLFLISDTGGGHRAAAGAVAQRLAECPGGFTAVLLDPLAGPAARWPLRQVVRLYGPAIRYAPALWAAAYRLTDSQPAMAVLLRTLLRPAGHPVRAAVAALEPAAVVAFHPLVTAAAVSAAGRAPHRIPVVTVITDLVTVHSSWRLPGADRVIVASAAARRGGAAPPEWIDLGLPVRAAFTGPLLAPAGRQALRRDLGAPPGRLLALVTGGGEGAGGVAWAARTLIRGTADIGVVAVCGRNERLRRRLGRLAATAGGRLAVTGFVPDLASWLRCADVVVTKPGPGTIAEAACCGTALLLTSPGRAQEAGNASLVIGAGAGRYARRPAELLREVTALRDDPAALARMRAAASRLGRPEAAAATARLIAGLAAGAPAGTAGLPGTAGLADTAGTVVKAGKPGLAPAGTAGRGGERRARG